MEFLAAGAIVLAILMIVIAAPLGRTRANASARVEALQALVAEAASGGPLPSPSAPSDIGDIHPDDWDFKLRAEPPVEVPAPAAVVSVPVVPVAARSIRGAAPVPSNRFVVNIPDASSGPRYQVSFQRGRN
jgi:hypothetical protein